MAWITPKTDWTSTDYYNYDDLNRVESNCQEIENLISTYSVAPTITVKTDRDNTRIEYYENLDTIESNILALRTSTAEPSGWIAPKTNWQSVRGSFSYTDANRLESNVSALYAMINNIIAELEYCGSLRCGQDFNFGGL